MNAPVQTRDVVTAFKSQVAHSENEFKAALPAHIPVERFMRVVNTAVTGNPDLLRADRVSLFQAAVKAAQDGLLPDGRDGALVVYGNKVQWMPMIGGILKKIRNSGELRSITAHVVYERDEFNYVLGDEEKIEHRPAIGERGQATLAYAIAHTKDGGIYREVMTVADIEKVRSVSRAGKSGPWVQWWGEMARKTVLRRLAKRLPMSTDLDDIIRRDDALYDFEGAGDRSRQASPPKGLADRLDALAAPAAQTIEHNPETGEITETDAGVGNSPGDASQAAEEPASAAAETSAADPFDGKSMAWRMGWEAAARGEKSAAPAEYDPYEADDYADGHDAWTEKNGGKAKKK